MGDGSQGPALLLAAAAVLAALAGAGFWAVFRPPKSRDAAGPSPSGKPGPGAPPAPPEEPLLIAMPARAAAPALPVDPTPTPVGQVPAAGGRKPIQIVRQIAEGGMGHIYEAYHPDRRCTVALKKLKAELSIERANKEAFLQEARIVSSLDHPNIVRIYEVLDCPDGLYLVFEFVEGCTVEELVFHKTRLSIGECRPIIRGVCAALEYAHGRRILHRDLKPGNIMTAAGGVVKVMDFGIARQAKETLSMLSPGFVCGTMAYMSPEQHLGEDRRPGDLYALAASLYHMLTGSLPFTGPNFLTQKEGMIYRPLSQAVSGMGERHDRFMARALAVSPKDRFQHAPEFLAAFEEAFQALCSAA